MTDRRILLVVISASTLLLIAAALLIYKPWKGAEQDLADSAGAAPTLRAVPVLGSRRGTTPPVPHSRPSLPIEPAIPEGVEYSVIRTDVVPGIKRGVDVRISRVVREADLKAIAVKLKGYDTREYERTYMTFWLPEQEVGSGAWATVEFTPEPSIEIHGFSSEHAIAVATSASPHEHSETVGVWIDNSPGLASRMKIYRQSSKFWLERTLKDGGSFREELIDQTSDATARFTPAEGSRRGDHYVINANGDLEIRDANGLIARAAKTK